LIVFDRDPLAVSGSSDCVYVVVPPVVLAFTGKTWIERRDDPMPPLM
jgi:hypothetical protein